MPKQIKMETIEHSSFNLLFCKLKTKILPKVMILLLISMISTALSSQCSTPIASFPISDDFETGGSSISWIQDTGDDFDWTLDSGGTGSSGTGPSSGANGSTFYMYTEASYPNSSGQIANLISPCLASNGEIVLDFSYHMYSSASIGTFNIDVKEENEANWTNIWTRNSSQGNQWNEESITIDNYIGSNIQIRFSVTTNTYRTDVAIDNITISSIAYSDSDGDGIVDVTDLDDDNDGILDEDEGICNQLSFHFNSSNEGWIEDNFNSGVLQDFTQASVAGGTTPQGCTNEIPSSPSGGYIYMDDNYSGDMWFQSPDNLNVDLSNEVGVGSLSFYWINGTYNNSATQTGAPLEIILVGGGTQVSAFFDVDGLVNIDVWTQFILPLNDATWSGSLSDLNSVLGDLDRVEIEIESVFNQDFGNGGSNCTNGEYFGLDEVVFSCTNLDYDSDGIPNYLDLDSDNDGCPDYVEGGGTFTQENDGQALLSGSLLSDGNGGQVTTNLGINIEEIDAALLGVPIVSPATNAVTQGIGSSQDSATNSCAEICNNGIDDDGDGLTDEFDPDCSCIPAGIPNLNFDQSPDGQYLAAGALIAETWAAYGVHISTTNVPSGTYPPMIFDSSNPTGDPDLGSPNSTFGGPGIGDGGEAGKIGENSTDMGNVIIISDSGDLNDYWQGGTIVFDFDVNVDIASLEIVDFDYGKTNGTVKAYDASNNLIVDRTIYAYGDNSCQKINISASNVRRLEVNATNSFSIATLNFCDDDLPTASIGDLVYYDADQNGAFNGESGIPNIPVLLYDDSNNLLAETVTDENGIYSFDNVLPGDFKVSINPPSNYMASGDLDSDDDNDSGVFSVASNVNRLDVDFGLKGGVEICNNGIDDDGDGDIDAMDSDCVSCSFVGQNLIVNGEFDQGVTGFTSDYPYRLPEAMCDGGYGFYSVLNNILQIDSPFDLCGQYIWAASDRNGTNGNFMVIDPSEATGEDDDIWAQSIPVCIETDYVFSIYTKNLYFLEAPNYSGVDPNFTFSINGTELPGANFTLPRQALADSLEWIKVEGTWNSGSSTVANLQVINQVSGDQGNDIAIDGIFFGLCGKANNISSDGSIVCNNLSVTLEASAETVSSGWNFYEWFRDDVVIASGPTTTSFVTNEPGTYKLLTYTTSDNSGCPEESNNEIILLSGAPTASIGSVDGTICSGESLSLTVSGSGTYVWSNGSTDESITVSPTSTTTYTVTVTAANGCTDSDEVTVNVMTVDGGIISGDEVNCTSYTAGTIESYEEASTSSGSFTYQWQTSNDNITWSNISGEITFSYTPGIISTTQYYRRATLDNICGETYSNVISKVVDGSLVICPEEKEFSFACEEGYKVSPVGTGITGVSDPALRVLNPTFMEYFIVEATFSGGANATDQVIFTNEDGDQKIVNKQYFEGQSGTNGDRYFRAILPPSDSVFLSYEGDASLAESFVVYTAAFKDNFSSSSKGYESFGKSVHKELLPGEEYIASWPLTPSINHKAVFANTALSSIVDDGTEIYVSVYGGGVSLTDTITSPSDDTSLELIFSNLKELDPNADSLHIKIESPASNGQTALISGYLAAIVECDQNIVVTADTDADCVAVGDVITYNYTIYNFADVEFTNLNASSSLGGIIDFGVTALPPNSQFSTTQDITITQDMIDNPPIVNSVLGYGFNFTFGIKPVNDNIIDTLTICEICDNGIDDDGDDLIDCLDPDCTDDLASVSSDDTICDGETITISASGGDTYLWDNGLGAGASHDVNPSTTTTYSVTVTSSAGCEDTGNVTINVNTPPVANIDSDGYLNCDNSALLLTAEPAGMEYLWSTGEETQSISADQAINYSVIVTDSNGCTDEDNVTVAENYTTPTFYGYENDTICQGETAVLSGYAIFIVKEVSDYLWLGTSNTTNTLSVSPTTTTTYTLVATGSNGCSDSMDVTVYVNPQLEVSVDFNGSECLSDNTQLTANITGGSGTYEYAWTGPDGFSETTKTVTVTQSGNYTVVVTDSDGCTAQTSGFVYSEFDPFIFTLSTTVCEGESVDLSVNGSNITDYAWDAGAGNSTSNQVTVTPSAPSSTYIVTVTNDNGCTSTASATINASPLPTVDAGSDVTICENNTTSIGTTDAGDGSIYTWDFGPDATPSNALGAGPHDVSYTNPNVDGSNKANTVTVTIDNGECVNTDTKTVTIRANPDVSVTSTSPSCGVDDGTITFTFDDNLARSNVKFSIDGGANYPYNVADNIGSFTVSDLPSGDYFLASIWGNDQCPVDLPSVTLDNADIPIISNIGNDTICLGTTTILDSDMIGTWQSDDTDVATISSAGLVFGVSAGVANISFIADNGCPSSSTIEITVENKVGVTITGDNILCEESSTTLSASQGGGTWISGNTGVATINSSGEVTAVSAGSVLISYDHPSNSCVLNSTFAIQVNEKPTANITGSAEICSGEVTQLFTNLIGGFWTSLDEDVAIVSSTGLVSGVGAGTTSFFYTSTNGCPSENTGDLIVNPALDLEINYHGSLCLTETSQLSTIVTGGTSDFTYSWTGPGGFAADTDTINIILDGNYYVTVTDAKGCTADISAFVYEQYEPFIFALNTTVCEGEEVTLSVNGQNVESYEWSASAGNASSQTVTVTPTVPSTSYIVTVTNTQGCSTEAVAEISVDALTDVSITGQSDICVGETTQLSPNTGGIWSSSNSSVASVSSTGLVTGNSNGSAVFTFKDDDTGCFSESTEPVTVGSNAPVTLIGDNSVCFSDTPTITASIAGGSWSSSNTNVATIDDTGKVTPVSQGFTTIMYSISGGDCYEDGNMDINIFNDPVLTLNGPSTICEDNSTFASASVIGTWTSSDTDIATISASGEILGVADGSVTITFESSVGCTATLSSDITIVGKVPVSLTGPSEICKNDLTTLSPTSGGIWISSNNFIASVNSVGVVTGKNEGTATFRWTF